MTTEEREGRIVRRVPEDTYARRLMIARDYAGRLSIREAAERCGLNYGTWSGWERGAGSRTMMEDTRIIAETLGVDLDWLRDGGPMPAPPERRLPRKALRRPYSGSSRPGTHARRPRRLNRHRVPA